MTSKKEEERNEKIIRGLMKLPPNRRCINCNSVGPQYVCTNFWTFVCMTCSGIHREFTHRVKSVSMSKFTSQEVEALQEGGNQRARETFFTHLDPRGQRLSDNSNADKVREFIKSVYVDKKYCAAKTSGKPPRDILNLRNNEDETRRASSYHSYSQSPPYDYQYEERRYGKQGPELTKKPGSDRGIFRFSSSSRLSDHAQDRFANEVPSARNSDYSASSGGVPFRSETQSPTSERVFNFSSPSSETSRDNLSEDVQQQQHSVETLLNLKPDPDQTTGSSGSTKPLSSDVVDLFSAPFAPQTNTSAPSAIDLFQSSVSSSALSVNNMQPRHNSTALTSSVNQQSQASSLDLFSDTLQKQFSETSKDKSSESIIPKNEGWATFDMPWHAEPGQGLQSLNPVSETSTSNEPQGKFDQALSPDVSSDWSLHLDFSANGPSSSLHNPWLEGLDNTGAPPSMVENQSWSSFENSTTPFERFHAQSNEQVPVRDQLVADPYIAWGILEGSKVTKADLYSQPHILSTMPCASEPRDSSCELPVLDSSLSFGLKRTFSNPFDLPSDSDIASSNMFMEMSSLQSALPNHNISTPWLTGNTGIPFTPDSSQDALVFLSVQAPSREIPNIPTQGPLASIGGNPFA